MSTKVFTANVFITKSRQAIQQLFFPGTKITSFTSNLAKLTPEELGNSFIASPSNNEGLLRFEYSFGMNKGNDPTKVMLSFVETSKLLEFVLLDDEPTAKKVQHAVAKMAHDSKPTTSLIDLSNLNLVENERRRDTRLSEDGAFSYLKEGSGGPKDIFSSLKDANTYYFAFGVGDDVRNWDGPHIMHLAAATLSNDDSNVRTVDVTFVANIDSLKAWSRNFEKELGYGETLKKFNQVYTARSFHRSEASVGPLELTPFTEEQIKETLIVRDTEVPGSLAAVTKVMKSQLQVSVNLNIRALLRRFIGTVTDREGNSVVAFPHILPNLIGNYPEPFPGRLASPTTGSFKLHKVFEDLLGGLGIRHLIGPKPIPKATAKVPAKVPAKAPSPSNLPAPSKDLPDILKRPPKEESTVARRKGWREWLQKYKTKEERIEDLGSRVGSFKEGFLVEFPMIFDERANSARRAVESAGGFPLTPSELEFYNRFPTSRNARGKEPFRQGTMKGTAFEWYWYPIFEQSYDILIKEIPKGMNENGIGNMEDYTEEQKEAFSKSISPGNIPLAGLGGANYASNYNAAVEQCHPPATIDKGTPTITFSLLNTNNYSDGKDSGFSPLLSPLTKFAAGLSEHPSLLEGSLSEEDLKSVVFDFFEETDLRILSLWESFGIIKDSGNSAFVFGDVQRIKNVLYLDDYMPPNYKQQKGDGTNQSMWETLVGDENKSRYSEYRGAFADIFRLKTSSRVSSFEKYDKIPEDSLAMELAKTQKFDFTKSDLLLKHNIENPNVVSLKYSTKNYITSLHSMQIRPELDKQIIGTTRLAAVKEVAEKLMGRLELRKLLKIVKGKTEDEIRVALATDAQARDQLTTMLADLVISKKFPELANVQIFDIVSLLLVSKKFDEMSKSKSAIVTPLQRFTNVRKDIMDRYVRQLFEVKVKTLPFFNHKLFIGKSCGLLGMTGGVLGADSSLRHLAPYTGNYTVHGWKHVISFSEVSTTLFLIRAGFGRASSAGKTTLTYIKENLEALKAEIESKYAKVSNKKPSWKSAAKRTRADSKARDMELIARLKKEGSHLTAQATTLFSWFDQGLGKLIDSGSEYFKWQADTTINFYSSNKTSNVGHLASVNPQYLLSPREVEMRLNGDDKELARLQELIDELPAG